MPPPSRRWGGTLVVGATFAFAISVFGLPAGAQTPPSSTVSISGVEAPSVSQYRSCDGDLIPVVASGGVTVTRTASVDDGLVVPIELTGDLVDSVDPLPMAATFAPGESTAVITVSPTDPGPGSLTLELLDGADHDLGTPSTADLSVGPPRGDPFPDCQEQIDVDLDRVAQVIEVGEVPEPLGLFEPRPSLMPTFVQVRGALPPGLTYAGDVWGGAATTLGTYRFAVSPCLSSDGTPPACLGTAEVTITVLGSRTPVADPPPAPSAVPVAAEARFTG